ncbi:hypothetical protein HUA76_05320 [Myxococcus sp. CA056]|uniref:hypothetical protein n=1 Tax=unclassified Myxococcus TaxID=2648731 RepID=UPI00157B70F8|nr:MULTISPECIES: hypothetical protein [unclassified Myxococcus]NTX10196.1 hypothetical protein [Myxococcus sp. CA056]NTX37602.1 hypothetical protein [Myxococcus sp. CA033]
MRPELLGGGLCLLGALLACGPGVDERDSPDGDTYEEEGVLRKPLRVDVEVLDPESADLHFRVWGIDFTPSMNVHVIGVGLTTEFVSKTQLHARLNPLLVKDMPEFPVEVRVEPGDYVYMSGARSPSVTASMPVPELHSLTPDVLEANPTAPIRIAVLGKNLVHGTQAVFRGIWYPVTLSSTRLGELWLPPEALTPTSGKQSLYLEVPRPRLLDTPALSLTVTASPPVASP